MRPGFVVSERGKIMNRSQQEHRKRLDEEPKSVARSFTKETGPNDAAETIGMLAVDLAQGCQETLRSASEASAISDRFRSAIHKDGSR